MKNFEEKILALRDATGAPFDYCKSTLINTHENFDKALEVISNERKDKGSKLHILKSFFNINYTLELFNKLYLTFFDKKPKLSNSENLKKINELKISSEIFIKKINHNLFDLSVVETDRIVESGFKIFFEKNPGINVGSNYAVEVLYFLTLNFKPKIILETGVAAGMSSYCFLDAIKKNNYGTLYSSDFPFLKYENPKQYIGVMVPNNLKKNWNLEIAGDNINIKKFKKQLNNIDLLFYDSDKRYSSKIKFFKSVKKLLNKESIIIIDDLHNDSFFLEYVEANNCKNWFIVQSKRDHIVGVILPQNLNI